MSEKSMFANVLCVTMKFLIIATDTLPITDILLLLLLQIQFLFI